MGNGGSMEGKARFWFGMGLNLLGVVTIISATDNMLMHGAGTLTVVLGVLLAARASRL